MKFLCVSCDEPMRLSATRGPENGSMTVIFGCPACGRETAMLTNAMETQVVRSLGVEIKARAHDGEPKAHHGAAEINVSSQDDASAIHSSSGSKCPFTGVVADAYAQNEIDWTEGAMARAERIPVFARKMAMKGVEDYAREKGYREVSESVLDEARGHLGL